MFAVERGGGGEEDRLLHYPFCEEGFDFVVEVYHFDDC